MLNALNKKYPFSDNLKANIRSIVGISLGIFLFLLFFQPLNPQNPDFNKKLLILATFGGITLVLLVLIRIVIPSLFVKTFNPKEWTLKKEIILNFLFLTLNSVAYIFFAKYVGLIKITFHIATVTILISIAAMVILVIINEFRHLRIRLEMYNEKKGDLEINEEQEHFNVKIEFESENKSEYFHLFINQIILIKSANNYIEVLYKIDEKLSRRLIRNTLKNTEVLFSKYPEMVRCHRSCIVNKNFIKKASKGADGLKLEIFDYPEKIHVSRQYVLKVKEALKQS